MPPTATAEAREGKIDAQILAAHGDFVAAEATLLAILSNQTPDPFGETEYMLPIRAREQLAKVRFLEGRHAEAEADARSVLDERPGSSDATAILSEALRAQGKPPVEFGDAPALAVRAHPNQFALQRARAFCRPAIVSCSARRTEATC